MQKTQIKKRNELIKTEEKRKRHKNYARLR